MINLEAVRAKFDELHTCVIIPTYNNFNTLGGVIADVAAYTKQIIVVNDGSVDKTAELAGSFPFVKLISYPDNVGKGWALRKAFSYAIEQGYEFAITIDSDGQHFAKDLPAFIDRLGSVQDAIIVGARNMDQHSVPGGSSFGNNFSNFWFKVETGLHCPDTQSGYRLYPLLLLKGIKFITVKYEFEIEVLVRAAWKGIKVDSIPVSVYYPPKEERISHFRPFKDFTRISILNTILVIITFLYIKPRDFFRMLFDKKKISRFLNEHLFHPHHSDTVKAASIALGVFMGIIPIWGFQMLVAVFLAMIFRLNKALVLIASNISIPPVIPLIIFGSYKMGAIWMGANTGSLEFSRNISMESIRNNLKQYILGSATLAILAGSIIGLLAFGLLKLFKKKPVLA
jgi:glycosyltransferase involved in cell wall biosynthesis